MFGLQKIANVKQKGAFSGAPFCDPQKPAASLFLELHHACIGGGFHARTKRTFRMRSAADAGLFGLD
jgi:hypothetical protein